MSLFQATRIGGYPPTKSGQIYENTRKNIFQYDTFPKTNIDIKHDGLEDVSPFQHSLLG